MHTIVLLKRYVHNTLINTLIILKIIKTNPTILFKNEKGQLLTKQI